MENEENRTLIFTEYVIRYIQKLKYYSVNMDLCGCTLNGECSLFRFFSLWIYVNTKNNILYCMRNDIYNKKCIKVKNNNIWNKKNVNKIVKNKNKERNFFNINKCYNLDYNPKEIN